ncbi:MAG: FAD-binding oxidoreductase [Actinomycetota bacterium]|nr:FAD-binding oxidoreductase [Actinomycetota bacterium]
MRVRVVGAGIVGLATAWRMRQSGHEVDIVAAEIGEQTTSAIAAALWMPYRALPEREVVRWAARGLDVLSTMATDPRTGVDLRTGRVLYRERTPDPWWAEAAPPLHRLDQAQRPAGFADGIELTVPVVDTPVHLRWLVDQLERVGTPVTRRHVGALEEAARDVDVVVNCAGLGAGALVGDHDLHPVRGQVLLVEQVGLQSWVLDETDPVDLTYVVPRRDTIVLGGTALAGDCDDAVRPETAEAILRRAVGLVPRLAGARVLGHQVGLRPARSAVRLERDGDVIHCYGHGGAGVTLAYGCAQDVDELLSQSRRCS